MAGLQFNDTTNKLGLIQQCEFLLNLGDGTISGNTAPDRLLYVFTRNINTWLHKIVTMIFGAQDEWQWDDINQTNYPIITTSLVANQQDYTLPAALGMLKIERVEVSYDSGSTWQRCQPFDKNESDQPVGNQTSVNNDFSIATPFYDIEYNTIMLYPIPTAISTNGLKIWYLRSAIEFVSSDTTKVPPIDIAFHNMLAIGASLDYASAKGMPVAETLASELQDYEARLRQYYGSKDLDRRMVMGSIYPGYGN